YFLDLGAQCDADLVELVKPKAKEFAVGQVWKQANGDYVKITRIADTSNEYPIIATFCDKTVRNIYGDEATYTLDGKCVSGEESKFDLVELVKPEPAPAPSPQFKVGQVWESRDGGQFTITDIDDHPVYPIEAVNGSWRRLFTSSGDYWASRPSDSDLVKLISEPEITPVALSEFKVGQVWESENGEEFTITDTQLPWQNYPIGAKRSRDGRLCTFTIDGRYLLSCAEPDEDMDLVKLIPELQAIFNGEKPVYVVVVEDDRGSANKRSVGIHGEPIVFETPITPGSSFASFREALKRQKTMGNRYGTTYIAECHIIRATRFDK
ncbi:hypothetical protein EBZ02_10275, partial [bacterium]|nr:hypothetical protein [bacterium]